jgi:muramidase (phage lysozyme)
MTNKDFISPNARRYLDIISFAEGTLGPQGRPRYDITFGYRPITNNLVDHPRRLYTSGDHTSDAAGAYQFLSTTWDRVAPMVKARDFGPRSQDLAALQLIRLRGVNPDRDPISPQTIARLAPEWASLPTLKGKSYWDQPVRSFKDIQRFVQNRAGRASVSYDPSVQYAAPEGTGEPGGTQGQPTNRAYDPVVASVITGLLKKAGEGDKDLERSTLSSPPLVEFKEEEDGDASSDKVLAYLMEAKEDEEAKAALRARNQAIASAESAQAETQDKLNRLMLQAQQAFTTPTPVI